MDDPLLRENDLIQKPAFFCMFIKEAVNFLTELLGKFNNATKFENTLCQILKYKKLAALTISGKPITKEEQKYSHLKLIKMIQSVCAKDLEESYSH